MLAMLAGAATAVAQLPTYDEQFTVRTMEATGLPPLPPPLNFVQNSTVVQQIISQDSKLHRSAMYAEGLLVKGYMQQIKRCDLPLGAAWFASMGGPDLTSLQCSA